MSSERIRELNDAFRKTGEGGQVLMTPRIAALPGSTRNALAIAIAACDVFAPDDDPHGEHDFGAVVVDGHKVWWKIDYYDESMTMASEDPADPVKTCRVLTILTPDEY